jgi:hypothetical protein
MASSGIVYSGYGRNSRVYVSWSVAETDIANNRWKLNWEAGIEISKSDEWYSNAVKINSVYIGGGSSLGSGTYSNVIGNGKHKKLSGSKWINANDDGNKNIEISVSGWFYSYGNVSGDNTFDLPNIPRKATIISAPNFIDGSNPTITYSNPMGNASFVVLKAGIYNADGSQSYIPYREISKTATSYTFNLTAEEWNNLRRATQASNSISVRFYVRTEINGTIFVSYLLRTFSITDANPIITASVVDTNADTIALTGDANKLIKHYSNAKATMSAVAQKGAAIDENLYIIRNGNASGDGTEHTFENVESNEFTFSAKDTRGNIGVESVVLPMVDYVKLTCNTADNRPDALGNMSVACTGNFFNGSFGAVENTLTVKYRYCASGGVFSEWADMNVTKDGNSYYASASFLIPDFDQQLYYTFETRAIDKLDIVSGNKASVKSTPIFHWGENDFVFEVPVTFKAGTTLDGEEGTKTIDGDMNITGNLRLKGSGNYGNTLLFGDGTYCYISEPEDDVMHIKASKIVLNANSVEVGGNPIYVTDRGRWSPSLNSSAISYYTTQEGWYSKIGQYVTVGFFVKAYCNSGYQSTNISISGLPFTPMFSAAGGGMCSGAYVSGGHNFQCFVAETSGNITIRTQACNNTTDTNLSTSASGCRYRSSGGEITLSGTITFMANS